MANKGALTFFNLIGVIEGVIVSEPVENLVAILEAAFVNDWLLVAEENQHWVLVNLHFAFLKEGEVVRGDEENALLVCIAEGYTF